MLPENLGLIGKSCSAKKLSGAPQCLGIPPHAHCLLRLDSGEEDESNASWGAKVLYVESRLPVSCCQLSAIRKILRDGH